MKNDNDLFFTCSLIEFIGRQQKLKRSDVVTYLGEEKVKRIYNYADVFHCEPIEKVADDFINICGIPTGEFDNVAKCKYAIPDYWKIGAVYERLIEDVSECLGKDVISCLLEVYSSWIDKTISNYNSDFFYQSREYIALCYKEEKVLE